MVTLDRPYIHPKHCKIDTELIKEGRVLFINMPLRESSPPNCIPYGVCLLSAILREKGVSPTIVDLNGYRKGCGEALSLDDAVSLIRRHIKKHGYPDVIALSGIITTLKWQEKIAKAIRTEYPDCFLVSGNGLATEFKAGLFNWIPELNAVAHSEGDLSILKIVHDALTIKRQGLECALSSGYLVPYYLGKVHGLPRFIYDGGRPDDLDLLPFPAYDLLEEDVDGYRILENYLINPIWGLSANNSSAAPFTMNRSLNTISSRGCPFACRFCFRGATGERNYGIRSAENFSKEMMHHACKYKTDFIGILDDNFMVKKQRVIDFSRMMKGFSDKTGLRWGVHGRLDEAKDERVHAMAQGGCVYIGFGGESASPRMLEAMGKGGFTLTNGIVEIDGYEFPRTYVDAIKNTRDAGIHANCTWIMGYPGETLKDLKTTVAFIKWQEELYGDEKSVNKNLFVATAYPGTEMFSHKIVKEKLYRNCGIIFDNYGQPKNDRFMRDYVLKLGDATEVIKSKNGTPLNFSDMTDSQFLEAKFHVEQNNLYKILEMDEN